MTFEIQTLGGFSFIVSERHIAPKLGAVTAELLAYLIINHKKQCHRESLAEIFWPSSTPEQARSTLNTAIWRINKLLNPDYLNIERCVDSVQLSVKNADTVLDFTALRNAVLEIESEENSPFLAHMPKTSWVAALDKYHGALFPTIDRHWILVERERYRCLYFRGCQNLMALFANLGHYERALSYGRKILKQDDLRENTHRQVIWLYVMNGQRHKALEQYKEMKRKLKDELGVEPMPETQSLLQHIHSMDRAIDTRLNPLLSKSKMDFTARFKHEQSKHTSTFKSLCMMQ